MQNKLDRFSALIVSFAFTVLGIFAIKNIKQALAAFVHIILQQLHTIMLVTATMAYFS